MLKTSLYVLVLLVVTSLGAEGQRAPSAPTVAPSVPSRADARYSLHPTQNIWTFLLLDTSTGRVWQVHYALSDSAYSGRLSLNDVPLVNAAGAHVGRFALQETKNIYTFLLLDQDDGRVWHLQWSNEEKNRGIIRVLANSQP